MLLNQPDIDESRMEEIYFYDTTINNTETRIIYRNYQNMKINPISIVEGNLPTSDTEVAVEQLPDNSQRKLETHSKLLRLFLSLELKEQQHSL